MGSLIKFADFCWLNLRQPALEMVNMRPSRTGLVATVHVMSRGGAKHGPRVKVSEICAITIVCDSARKARLES